jgi:hypothetical protein
VKKRVEPTIKGRAFSSVSRTKEAVAAMTHLREVQFKQNLEGWSKRQIHLQVAKQHRRGAGLNCAVVNRKWNERVAEIRAAAATGRRTERVSGKREGNAPTPTVPTVPAGS